VRLADGLGRRAKFVQAPRINKLGKREEEVTVLCHLWTHAKD
jgi:hypothetical protein